MNLYLITIIQKEKVSMWAAPYVPTQHLALAQILYG